MTALDRRRFCALSAAGVFSFANASANQQRRPNIILMMSDDQGWADAGFRGHPHLKTPALDEMARRSLVFDRFYAAAPVCSPTRASCLTGRHPYRMGILGANSGDATTPSRYPLPDAELTLAEALKPLGYAAGHFGKWHLGDVEGPNACTPGDHGFDEWFSTVRKVATLDPEGYVENGDPVPPLEGDDSKIIMDRALPFIEKAVENNQPFFTVIWFHTPHVPFIADDDHRALYDEHSEAQQNFWGALTAMDEQIGRLRRELRRLGAADDTMLWFCSDNGARDRGPEFPGVNLPYRSGKATLYEGGIRVIGMLEWPNEITEARQTDMACSTSDYLPTIFDYLGLDTGKARQPLDGISLRSAIDGRRHKRGEPIGFWHRERAAWVEERYKLIMNADGDENAELYDLALDPGETRNLAEAMAEQRERMSADLRDWMRSCRPEAASG